MRTIYILQEHFARGAGTVHAFATKSSAERAAQTIVAARHLGDGRDRGDDVIHWPHREGWKALELFPVQLQD